MGLNNAGACRQCGEVRNRSRAGGVQVDGNSRRDTFPQSGGENELVTEGFGNRSSGFKKRLKMYLGGLLKPQHGLTTVASMCMAAGQQQRFGNPHAVFVPPETYFRQWNNHGL